MGSIAEKLSYLVHTKELIKNAIEVMGVKVPDDTAFRIYADLIRQIGTDPDAGHYVASCIVGTSYMKAYDGFIVVPTAEVIVSELKMQYSSGLVIIPSTAVKIGEYVVETT